MAAESRCHDHEAVEGKHSSERSHLSGSRSSNRLPSFHPARQAVLVLLKFQRGIWITWGSCQNSDSDPVDPGWGLRICISHNFPSDVEAASPKATLGVTMVYEADLGISHISPLVSMSSVAAWVQVLYASPLENCLVAPSIHTAPG